MATGAADGLGNLKRAAERGPRRTGLKAVVFLAIAAGAAGLAALLPEGMRAAAVRVDDVVGVAGFIHPGDHVDVIATMRNEDRRAGDYTSKIILQNIRVLAVGKQLERNDRAVEKSIPVTVATLMVDSEQSEMLALSASKGQILLTLRSRIDDDIVQTAGVSPPALVGAAPQVVARAVRKGAPPPPPARKDSVEILRGNLYERRDFEARAGR